MPLLTVARNPISLLRFSEVDHPERGVGRGDLVKVRPGVYAGAPEWNALAPWDRYLARIHAVGLVCPDVIFSHESAAALLGMAVFGDPVVVHVLASPLATARLVGGIHVHTTGGHCEVTELSGMLMTSPAETAIDLARSRHAALALAAADAALRIDPTLSREMLGAMNERRASKRGRALARWPLGAATGLAETALESVSRAVIEWLGFPPPTLQVTFRSPGGHVDRSDFVWPGSSLAGESDGDLKFDGRYGDPRELLRRQRQRDARLRAGHVEAVAHWGWVEATTVDPLRSLLLGHGLRPVAPEHPSRLFSLRRAVSPHAPHRSAPSSSNSAETSVGRRDRG